MFIQTTDRLLNDPELLKQSQMDIKFTDPNDEEALGKVPQQPNTINMVSFNDQSNWLPNIGLRSWCL
jgi:hypothetical protein